MPISFQMKEAMYPVVLTVLLSGVSMTPLFYVGYWAVGLLLTAVMCIVLRSIYSGLMYLLSEPTEEGNRYIGPSVHGLAEMFSLLLGLVAAAAGFWSAAYIAGWPPIN